MHSVLLQTGARAECLGLELTESYAMMPGASVSGWYFWRPESTYFGVGKLLPDQLDEYAERAGRIVALETKLAAAHWDVVRRRDADLTYNLRTFAELEERGTFPHDEHPVQFHHVPVIDSTWTAADADSMPDDPADLVAIGRGEARGGEGAVHRVADAGLAIDQGAVAIEHGKARGAHPRYFFAGPGEPLPLVGPRFLGASRVPALPAGARSPALRPTLSGDARSEACGAEVKS